jgi:tetratricopeptide (TPR) repeat protein
LTDQGDHQQAAAVLRHATTLEPTNAEAWANLTLAYSRQGSVEPGIAAARRGLALNPRHYYLNFMLAQMLYARGEVSEVIPVAERALAEAPSRQDRVNTLVLMGQTYYLLKNKVDACRMLTTAHGTQPSEATALQIKTWQCSGL